MKFIAKGFERQKAERDGYEKKGRAWESSIWKMAMPAFVLLIAGAFLPSLEVKAGSINAIQQDIKDHTDQLANINNQISSLEEEQEDRKSVV